MSRSYKRAIIKYAPTRGRTGKKAANRKVRRSTGIPNGKAYRKVFETWDIHDASYDGRFERKETFLGGKVFTTSDHLPNGSRKKNGVWIIPK